MPAGPVTQRDPAAQTLQPPAAVQQPASTDSSGGVDWSSILNTASSVAPYALAGGLGLYTANRASNQDAQKVNTLTQLGKPYMTASQGLLSQSEAGRLTPDQSAVVSLAAQQGQDLINAASPLASIANTGFKQYQAGQLQPGQQQQLDAWVAAQKAQLKQTLGSAGVADSTILATQGAAIDSQAEQMKQQMLQQNLGIADQQFSQWLTTTQAGQQVQMAGKQFAVTSLDNMLNQALQLGSLGMQPIQNAVALGVQSDAQLSQSISQLMQGLMTSYAISTYNKGGANATGGGIGSAIGGLIKGFGGGTASDPAAAARASGAIDTGTISSQYAGSQGGPPPGVQDPTTGFYNPGTDPNADMNNIPTPGLDMVNADTFNGYFFDPSTVDLPEIDFGNG